MATEGITALRHEAAKSMKDPVFLLWSSVFLLHAMLPVRTDISIFIIASAVLAIVAARGKRLFSDLSPMQKLPVGGMGLFLLAAAITTALHPETAPGALRALLWALLAFTGFTLGRLRPGHDFTWLSATALTLALTFAAGMLFWQLPGNADPIWHDGRLKLFARHPSRLAVYCAVALFWCLHKFIEYPERRPQGRGRFIYLGMVLLSSAMILLTNTRAMILLLPMGLILFALTVPPRFRKTVVVLLAVFCLGTAGMLYAVKDTFTGRRLISAATNISEDTTLLTRLPIWEAGWESFRDAPLFGHGMFSYRQKHTEYRAVHEEEWKSRYQKAGYEHEVKHAHNIVLGRMVETGALGAAGFFVFYLGGAACAAFSRRENRWAAAFLVYYACVGLLDDPLFRMNDAFVILMAGACIGLPRPEAEKR